MKGLNTFLLIFVFFVLFLRLYQIYKYGLSGYYEKKVERRQKRNEEIINFFN
jgi:hypothetical protein